MTTYLFLKKIAKIKYLTIKTFMLHATASYFKFNIRAMDTLKIVLLDIVFLLKDIVMRHKI